MADLVNMALSENSKSQYQTAVNHIERCADYTGMDMSLPFNLAKTYNYVGFLLEVRKVKAAIVGQCLSALRYLHLSRGQDPGCLGPDLVCFILRGRQHFEQVEKTLLNKPVKVAMTTAIMRFIKHELLEGPFTKEEAVLSWAASTSLFTGSMRVHEMLSRSDKFDPMSTLLYEDLELVTIKIGGQDKSLMRLKLKSPKENRVGNGVTIEIFANDTDLCPVRAMKKWLAMHTVRHEVGLPLLRWSNGHCFTGREFNKMLSQITGPLLEGSNAVVRSHSFHSGLVCQFVCLALTSSLGLRQRWD